MSPELLKVAARARREPDAQFHSLAHLIDVPALQRAFERLRPNAAVGVDGVTKEMYGQRLDDNLRDLHERLRSMRYRHQPIRRRVRRCRLYQRDEYHRRRRLHGLVPIDIRPRHSARRRNSGRTDPRDVPAVHPLLAVVLSSGTPSFGDV
jgi:hypothetical protein